MLLGEHRQHWEFIYVFRAAGSPTQHLVTIFVVISFVKLGRRVNISQQDIILIHVGELRSSTGHSRAHDYNLLSNIGWALGSTA